jgi:hypothetical protein
MTPAQLRALALLQGAWLGAGPRWLGWRWALAVPAIPARLRLADGRTRATDAHDCGQFGDGLVDHLVSPAAGRCRWRVAPTAPRAFPGPRSPCGPCQARRPDAGSPCGAGRPRGRGDRWVGVRRAWPAPEAPRSRWLLAALRGQRRVQALPPEQRALAGLVEALVLIEDPRLVPGRVPARAAGTLGHLGAGSVRSFVAPD